MRAEFSFGPGPFTIHQAVAAGLTKDEVRSEVRSGRWVRLRQGIFVTAYDRARAASEPASLHAQDVHALMLALSRRRVVAAGPSAARIYGLRFLTPPPEDLVVLTDDPGVASTHRDGYYLRVGNLPADHVRLRYSVPVTSPARTLLDLAANLDFAESVVLADSAYALHLVQRHDLMAVLDDAERRPGVHAARAALTFADENAESVLESVSRIAMRALGIPLPLTQVVLLEGPPKIRVDFYWPQFRLVGEADGMAKYLPDGDRVRTLAAIRAEREREQRLRDAGFDIVRWDWAVANDPARLAARLNAAFARANERQAGRSS